MATAVATQRPSDFADLALGPALAICPGMSAKLSAARAAYAPKSALRIAAKDCAAVAFVGTMERAGELRPYAVVFTGRARKPHTISGMYRTAAKRDAAVADVFRGQAKREADTKARREADRAARRNHKLTVGSIVVTSWGYDQTNVDAYEVVKVSGSMVTIRRVYVRGVEGTDRVRPVPGHFAGETMRRRVTATGESVKIDDGRGWAHLWDGDQTYYRTPSGFGH